MKIRNVLSLFDGISCGQVALRKAGIIYDKYYASEIEKQPIWVTQYNFPNTIQLGDVEKWKEWNIDWSKIDLLIGGSPCTNLSIAGNRKGLEGEQSRLFYSYVDILNHIKKFNPNIKFLLENVESMSDENKGIINNYMGCKPVMINSALLSAQNRKRYYWVNWHLKKESLFGLPTCTIPQPKDKGIVLKDILESSVKEIKEPNLAHYLREFGSKGKILLDEEKSSTLTAAMGEGGGNIPCVANDVTEPICVNSQSGRSDGKGKQPFVEDRIYSVEGKGVALNTNWHQNVAEPIPCAMRKRENGKVPEFNGTYKANALTTVQTDSMVCEPLDKESETIIKSYKNFGDKNGYIPEVFSPYNVSELNDKSYALTTKCGDPRSLCGTVLFEKVSDNEEEKEQQKCKQISNYVQKKYDEFSKKKGYIPEMFNPYDKSEITEKSPALTTNCGTTTSSSSVLIFEDANSFVGRENDAESKTVKVGDKDYEFCENGGTKSDELDYVGGIVSKRKKWVEDGKNLSRNFSQGNHVYSVRGKSVCLSANGGGIGSKTGLYKINLPDGDYIIRKLTPIECERLQTLPDNYTKYGTENGNKVTISNSARYKALGNGWTVDVIVHILKFLKEE